MVRLERRLERTAGPRRYLVHRDADGSLDGVATYRLPWSTRIEETGTLAVEGLQAASDDAYLAMWQLLLDFDLTRKVVAAPRPSDEPLRWMLDDPRAMRVTRQSDSLWVRLLDVQAALAARAYDVSGTIVLGVEPIPCARATRAHGGSTAAPTAPPAPGSRPPPTW